MDFIFSEDQYLFRDSIEKLLKTEVTTASIRARWESSTGFDESLWDKLREMGLPGMLCSPAIGGLGMVPADFILIAEECGRVALPEPLIECSFVAVPLLMDLYDLTASPTCLSVLERVQRESTVVLIADEQNPYLNFASRADAVILESGGDIYLVDGERIVDKSFHSLDPSRRLSSLARDVAEQDKVLLASDAGALWASAVNRGVVGTAAELLGLAQGLLKAAVLYSCERHQFQRPVGSNQALKHMLADCLVKIEFARPVVYSAAAMLGSMGPKTSAVASHAKVAAGEAALDVARAAIQVHGAMGYTWECDAQIWFKRIWALDKAWGDERLHKKRLSGLLKNGSVAAGAGATFEALPAETGRAA